MDEIKENGNNINSKSNQNLNNSQIINNNILNNSEIGPDKQEITNEEQQIQQQINEEVSKEQLLQILKDKLKEIKTVNTKLQKLEQKYVKTYRESKFTTKDRDSFFKLLKQVILNQEPYKIQEKNLGEYEYEDLKRLFEIREEEKIQSLNNMITELSKEKIQLEQLYQNKFQLQVNSMDQINQNLIATLKSQKYDIEQNSTKLAKEIVSLNDLLSEKNQEIQKLRQIDDEFQAYKAEILLKELKSVKQKTTDNVQKRIKESDKQNEIFKVKNQLDNAYDQIYRLEKQNKELQNQIGFANEGNKFKQEKKFQTIGVQTIIITNYLNSNNLNSDRNELMGEPDVIIYQQSKCGDNDLLEEQKFHIDCQNSSSIQIKQENKNNNNTNNNNIQQIFQDSPSYIKQNSQKSISISKFDEDLLNSNGNTNNNLKLNQEYLKNVILKYFVYQESKNQKEAQILMGAILTILKMTPDERRKIDQAREFGSIWTTTKTWLTWSKYKDIDFPKTGSGGTY